MFLESYLVVFSIESAQILSNYPSQGILKLNNLLISNKVSAQTFCENLNLTSYVWPHMCKELFYKISQFHILCVTLRIVMGTHNDISLISDGE